jgi:isocitrate/isopropylmalate dehydrogenase
MVTDNLFGDLHRPRQRHQRWVGLAASGNIDPSHANPSIFAPVHGSAPLTAGQGKADPTAAVLSAAMLLEHVGQAEAADRVRAAVARDLAARDPRDPGSTHERGERLAKRCGIPKTGLIRPGSSRGRTNRMPLDADIAAFLERVGPTGFEGGAGSWR